MNLDENLPILKQYYDLGREHEEILEMQRLDQVVEEVSGCWEQ